MNREQQLVTDMSNSIGSRHRDPKFFNGTVVLITAVYPEMRPEQPEHLKVWLDVYSAAVRHGFIDC